MCTHYLVSPSANTLQNYSTAYRHIDLDVVVKIQDSSISTRVPLKATSTLLLTPGNL